MSELISVAIYCVLGIVLMLLGAFVVDLVIPCHFPTEIKKKNVAVGSVMAGISIGIGIIIKSAVMTISIETVEETLVEGMLSTVGYYFVGLVFCVIGYLLLNLINKKYNLNQEIGEGNPAAGIMVAGMFIGLCTIISGVIM